MSALRRHSGSADCLTWRGIEPRRLSVQAYEHTSQLVAAFADVPMGVEVLVQIDRLVQLLETPVFTFLRLQLLQPARYPALIRSAPSYPSPPPSLWLPYADLGMRLSLNDWMGV